MKKVYAYSKSLFHEHLMDRYRVDVDERNYRRRAAANAAYVSQRKSAPRERPDYFEARSKRVNLLLKPSVYEAGLVLADDMAISFNHLMELAIIEYTERHLQIDDDEQEQ